MTKQPTPEQQALMQLMAFAQDQHNHLAQSGQAGSANAVVVVANGAREALIRAFPELNTEQPKEGQPDAVA